MSDLMRSVLDSLLPPGTAFRLKPDGDFSHLLDAVADDLEAVRAGVGALGLVRDPWRTPCLEELERDFGIDPNTDLTEAQRRANLAVVMFSRRRRGTLDELQSALDRSGYGDGGLGLQVFANDPATDPGLFMADFYIKTMCGAATALCGYSLSGLALVPSTGIAWNGSVFCAIAADTCATSPDGITWTAQSIGVGAWAAVCWNGTVFCAVGDGVCATSPTGVTWTTRTIASGAWTALCWSGTQFCAVGAGPTNYCATSPTGTTWTPQGGITPQTWKSIAWNGSVFCAIGYWSCQTSPDGITWTNRSIGISQWTAVAWNGSVFCAVGIYGYSCTTSPDGITWTSHYPTPSGAYYALVWAPSLGLFVAVGSGANQCITSPDGATWTKRTIPPSAWRAIAWNGTNCLCAVGSGSIPEATSSDGLGWTPRSPGVQAFCGNSGLGSGGVYVVNGDVYLQSPAYWGCGDASMLCAFIPTGTDVTAVCGRYTSLQYAPVIWASPEDEGAWPLIFFIAASATYDGDGYITGFVNGSVPQARRQFLIELILRWKPVHTWAGLLVDFI